MSCLQLFDGGRLSALPWERGGWDSHIELGLLGGWDSQGTLCSLSKLLTRQPASSARERKQIAGKCRHLSSLRVNVIRS